MKASVLISKENFERWECRSCIDGCEVEPCVLFIEHDASINPTNCPLDGSSCKWHKCDE